MWIFHNEELWISKLHICFKDALDGLQNTLSVSRKSVSLRPVSPRPSPLNSNSAGPTAFGFERKQVESSCQESSDNNTLLELTFDETSTSEELVRPIPSLNNVSTENLEPQPKQEPPCDIIVPKPVLPPVGAEYMSFRENVFFGLVDSGGETTIGDTNLISSKSGAVDLSRPHCACFPFIKYWGWNRQKNW